jgi:hypothetical protein
MRLRLQLLGLLTAAVMLVAMLAAWWIVERRSLHPAVVASGTAPARDGIHHPSMRFSAEREANGVTPMAMGSRTVGQRGDIWVVWYGDDGRVYRLEVKSAALKELYAALHHSMNQDTGRLGTISDDYLNAALDVPFRELAPRVDPFLDDLFGVRSAANLLSQALAVAGPAADRGAGAEQLLSDAKAKLSAAVAERFRDDVLRPAASVRTVRLAAARAFALLHDDLLQDCDRYDRAFEGFVLMTPGTVEVREGDAGWRPDPSWQQSNATFMSLCEGLREADAGPPPDTTLAGAFAAAEANVATQAAALVQPVASTAVGVVLRKRAVVRVLGKVGLPSLVARPLAAVVSYVLSAWSLLHQVLGGLDGGRERQLFAVGLRSALKGLDVDGRQGLGKAYRDFLSLELGRMRLALSARGEGAWSRP